mmetsp:Transcript_20619/g.48633  ORF Transcript_20619/g.48633 Transcript_20619/m.48633 type:complete len:499 (-) Transcript_20619:1402-2898(-)
MGANISVDDAFIDLTIMMTRQFSEPLRLVVTLGLLLFPLLFKTVTALAQQQHQQPQQLQQQQCSAPSSGPTTYRHLVVLVHGYLGSFREQEYLGESLIRETAKLIDDNDEDTTDESSSSSWCEIRSSGEHQMVILNSKANTEVSTDGVAQGGKRLAAEISEWVAQQTAAIDRTGGAPSSNTVTTFSLIGNSLGGLYGRYALAELDFLRDESHPIIPLVFCTTSSPHIGVSQETFIELPRWIEPHVATVFRQQTMDDLFGVNDSTIVRDMCLNPTLDSNDDRTKHNDHERRVPDFLHPLQRFQKRIALANAYKTDFLVSVSSGAFLSRESDSIHHHQDSVTSTTRLMKDTGHIALQVVTEPRARKIEKSINSSTAETRDDNNVNESIAATTTTTLGDCVQSLDDLEWHKIFVDTRKILPGFMNLQTPELKPKPTYTSKELKDHFDSYGTLFPVAHPLNMANSKTDLYRKITQSGQPVVDALAELLVLNMVEISEQQHRS